MLKIEDVTYTYPFQNTPAVRDISLSVRAGEAILLTGASGCGKSTVIRLANGLIPHYYQGKMQGRVQIKDIENRKRPISDIATDVGTLFQDPESQFFAVTVRDEVAMACEWHGLPPEQIEKAVHDVSTQYGIKTILNNSILHLSEGQKQKVALASISSLHPKILILDEPSANLDPESTRDLAAMLKNYKEQGAAILIVDHRLYWLRDVVDRVLVMDKGQIAAEGPFSLLDENQLRERYGLRKANVVDSREILPQLKQEKNTCVSLRDVSFAYKGLPPLINKANLDLPERKIIGLIGQNGAGKTTFARLLTGLLKANSGQFLLRSSPCTPGELLKSASIVLQNSDHQLYMKTVLQEILSSAQSQKDFSNKDAMSLLQDYNLDHLADRHPQSLSGGEKQRLVIACGQAKSPDILILDEPTSGLDGANMDIIAWNTRKAARNGACVLLISHDLELLQDICDLRLNFPLNP